MTLSLRNLSMPLVLILALTLGGCGSIKKEEQGGDTSSSFNSKDYDSDSSGLEINDDSDSGEAGALQTVNFPFDSSTLTSTARQKLQNNVRYLKDNDDVEIQIEGHCDERGGVQYNLALGERRAKSVKDYMVAMGIDSDRLSTISYGKERPIAFGHNSQAWAQNRRANFVVTSL